MHARFLMSIRGETAVWPLRSRIAQRLGIGAVELLGWGKRLLLLLLLLLCCCCLARDFDVVAHGRLLSREPLFYLASLLEICCAFSGRMIRLLLYE